MKKKTDLPREVKRAILLLRSSETEMDSSLMATFEELVRGFLLCHL